jgi:integrase
MDEATGITETAKGKRSKEPPTKARGIFERDGAWWISWCCTEGHRHRQPIGPHKLAVQEHGAQRKEVEKAKRLGLPYCPEVERKRRLAERKKRVPFTEIAQDFLDYAKAHKRDQQDGQRMTRLLSVFRGKLAAEITPQDVEAYKVNPPLRKPKVIKSKAGEPAPAPPKPLSVATVNRDLSLFKAAFNRALKAGKVESNPVKAVPLFKENNARTCCLTDEEEARLYAALPDYLKPFLTVALNTGMRWGELARLTWDDVDFYTGTLQSGRASPAKAGASP